MKEIEIEDHIRKIMILKFASLLGSDRLLFGNLTESDSVKFQQGGETYYLCIDLMIQDQKEHEKHQLD